MPPLRRFWVDQLVPAEIEHPGPRSRRDWVVDIVCFVFAVGVGLLLLSDAVLNPVDELSTPQFVLDLVLGSLVCLSLWWRRRWPVGVAAAAALLNTFSVFGTVALAIALFSLAVHRSARPVLLVTSLTVPSCLVFAIYRAQTVPLWVILVGSVLYVAPIIGWGMFVRARRQLIFTLRERAQRAEADQALHAERARTAERARIAREMHDVLAHRISLVALHAGALEVRPDLPPEKIRETAELLRSTARQALEELRGVIGVLRDDPGQDTAWTTPQPTLCDIPRLIEDNQLGGAKIDFEIRVAHPDAAPIALGRDAYRIVQEALTNIGKHARGTASQVRVSGAADSGLHVNVRNRLPVDAHAGSALLGSGAGLLGL